MAAAGWTHAPMLALLGSALQEWARSGAPPDAVTVRGQSLPRPRLELLKEQTILRVAYDAFDNVFERALAAYDAFTDAPEAFACPCDTCAA